MIGLDEVLAFATRIGDVDSIEALRGERGWDGSWIVRVRGERKYRISFNAEGKGSTLDIACREAIHRLERVAAE